MEQNSLQGLQNSFDQTDAIAAQQLSNPHSTPKQLAHLENARPSAHKARRMSAKQLREEAIRVASVNMVTEFLKVKGLRSDCFENDAQPAPPAPIAQPAAIAAIASAQLAAQTPPISQPHSKKMRAKKHVKPLTPPTTEDESTVQTETATETEISEIECPQPRKRKHRNLVFEEPRYERYIEPTRFYSSSSQFCS